MIDETTLKVDRKVDGKFELTVGDNPDIYSKSAVITKLKEQLEVEEEKLKKLRRDNILELFRSIIHEHEAKFGMAPTRVLLNYREFAYIVEAYNNEERENSRYQSTYSDTAEIDGITICKGCNTEPQYFRLETRV